MKIKFNIRREIKIATALVAVIGLIAFTERMTGDVSVGDIVIRLSNVRENHFVEEADVLDLLQWNHQHVRGVSLKKINFRDMEQRILKDPFIGKAEVYGDLKGNIIVNAQLRRPVARIIRNNGPDGYIAEDGTMMPVSEKFTARVVLISGAFAEKLLKVKNVSELEEGAALMTFIRTLYEDEFWNAQIAQLDVNGQGKITLQPQVGDERIEFGKADKIEVKLKKLKIFYKEILPRVGWNKYDRVNLEYEGQIIAE